MTFTDKVVNSKGFKRSIIIGSILTAAYVGYSVIRPFFDIYAGNNGESSYRITAGSASDGSALVERMTNFPDLTTKTNSVDDNSTNKEDSILFLGLRRVNVSAARRELGLE